MPGVFCILLVFPSLVLSITLGTITDRPSKYYLKYRILADYIQRKLAEAGIKEKVGVRFARDVDQMIALVAQGKVDVIVDSVYPTLKVCEATGCEPFLIRWKNGVRTYRSVIFVRKDSQVRSVRDLLGSKIAFDSPYSTSGYLIPKALLEKRGINLIRLESLNQKVLENSVGYIFAGEEENVVAWVFFGRVEAGATSDIKLKSVSGGRDLFRVILVSHEIPRHIVSFSASLDGRLRDLLVDILTSMDEDPEGLGVLTAFDGTTRFERLDQKDVSIITSIRNLIR